MNEMLGYSARVTLLTSAWQMNVTAERLTVENYWWVPKPPKR
jgi:hypothetical protein